MYDLKEGDHVVLQASTAVDMPGAGRSNAGRLGNSVVATPDMTSAAQAESRQDLGGGWSRGDARPHPQRTDQFQLAHARDDHPHGPVQEIVIAVEPQEVALLDEAMDLKYEITCMAHSGRPASAPSAAAHSIGGQTPEERNARQGSGGNGHHAWTEPYG